MKGFTPRLSAGKVLWFFKKTQKAPPSPSKGPSAAFEKRGRGYQTRKSPSFPPRRWETASWGEGEALSLLIFSISYKAAEERRKIFIPYM